MDIKEGDVLEYDVVVVGGGPCGSTTARFAAKNGAKTLLIEKRQEIGSPVRCAEGISTSWLKELEIEDIYRSEGHPMKGANIYSPDGSVVRITEEMAGDEVGLVVERDIFDKDMARRAAEEGADILVKTSVYGLLKQDSKVVGVKARRMGVSFKVKADLVIGADGFESQVGRWAGIYDSIHPNDIMTCFQYRMTDIDIDEDYSHFYLGSRAPGGYIWVFPKDKNTANVGIGVQLSRLENDETPKEYLDKFIEGKHELKKGEIIDMVAGAVSVTHPPKKVIADGLILVGDASRVVDPMTGGGIVNGLKQAKIAGEVAAEAVKEGRNDEEFLQRYEERWRDRLEDKLWRNYMAKETAMKLDDETFNKIIDALSDIELEKVSVGIILEGVKKKYPELVKGFEDML